MRGKKISRQLKKSLECEEIERHLPEVQQWLATNGTSAPECVNFLIRNFGGFLDAVEESYSQYESNLSHAQRSLELSGKEVEERNKLLRLEVKKVSDLLNNMRQAVFSVGPDGAIMAPVSKFADQVFGRSLIGSNIYEAVYPELDRNGEELANLKSAMIAVYDESELQWDLMEGSFPRRAVIFPPGTSRTGENLRVLKIAVGPIWNEKNELERIMFIVEDVTEVELLERKMAEEKAKANRNMQIIHEMVGLGRAQLCDFLSRATDSIRETRMQMETQSTPDFDLLFRDLHTLKGNARGYKFRLISAAAHRVENLIATCRSRDAVNYWNLRKKDVLAEMLALQDQISEYVNLAQRILGIEPRPGFPCGLETFSADSNAQLVRLVERLRPVLARLTHQIKHPGLSEVCELVERATDIPVLPVLEHLALMARDVADELGKYVVIEVVDPSQAVIAPKLLAAIQDALVHLVRNAVDHGIEVAEERKNAGKSPAGTLRFAVDVSQPGNITFIIQDDGRGLDATRIARKAISLGLIDEKNADGLSEREKYELIFLSGFTTKKYISETSGRGVGLDAARVFIEQIGGRVEIRTEKGYGTTFVLTVATPVHRENALPVTG